MRRFEVYARDERTIRLKEKFFRQNGFVPFPPAQTDTGDWYMQVWEVGA